MMEVPEQPEQLEAYEIHKRCYQCESQSLDTVSIVYNTSSSMIVLWNKYQIFVYEDLNFTSTAVTLIPEFQVHQLAISNNYLVCLDTSGNIHTSSMKFKNPAQKRFKSSFQPREQGVLGCIQPEDSNILSIMHECDVYFLCQNKVNTEFTLEKKAVLLNNGQWPLPKPIQERCLLTSHKLSGPEFNYVNEVFETQNHITQYDCSLIIMSFDKFTVYGCLFSPKMSEEDITLVKLYTCPSEICNIEIVHLQDLFVVIGLNIGTLVKLNLKDVSNKPELVHLNTALHKFLTLKDTVIYTDGRSMWKTDSTFTDDISFFQFFVRHVKDFVRFGDQIICTTFTNLIYIFPIDDESSFIKPTTIDEYCSAEKLLNNTEYLHKILEELEKNNELTKRINEEGNFITAFSLSNRQDIIDNIINYSVTVYEYYDDVRTDNCDITLTEKMHEYFDQNAIFILVKLSTTTLQHMFSNILSNLLNDVKIHITLSTEQKSLKTASVKVTDKFKKLNMLLPLVISDENIAEINVNMELITSVPGAYDEKQRLWVTLYRKQVVLYAEHFIKTTPARQVYLEDKESIDEIVLKCTSALSGGLYKFTDISKHKLMPKFTVYLKLPHNYKDLFKNEANSIDYLNKRKATQIAQYYTSDEFLRAKNSICLDIANKQVEVEILCDEFTSPMLKVSSGSMAISFHIRNFFSKIIYDNFRNYCPGREFVNYMLYNNAENLQKEIKTCVVKQADFYEFLPHAEKFEKNIIGALPL